MLRVENLSVAFTRYDVGMKKKELQVISRLDLEVREGELVAVIGSSGSGKSLLAHAVLWLLPGNALVSGKILYKGEPLTPRRAEALRGKEIALIPQSVNFLDPLQRVGAQVRRAAYLSGRTHRQSRAAQAEAFRRYGLPGLVDRLYPFQISGGMARRVLLACATAGRAHLVIADEPTPGLHAAAVKETLDHLRELADGGKGVILISHDMEAALQVADRISVFYAGTTVEDAPAGNFSGDGGKLHHPYTRALWRALPRQGLEALPGAPPSAGALPRGCPFAERCFMRVDACMEDMPPKKRTEGGFARCIRVGS